MKTKTNKPFLITYLLLAVASLAQGMEKGRLVRDSEFQGVVRLTAIAMGEKKKEGGAAVESLEGCTGTAIAEWILTAAHCLENVDEKMVMLSDGKQTTLLIDNKKIFRHPRADMALIQLREPFPNAYGIDLLGASDYMPLSRFDKPDRYTTEQLTLRSFTGTLVGFGTSEEKEEQVIGILSAKKRAGTIRLLGSRNAFLGSDKYPADLLAVPKPSLSRGGDSGGPVFISEGGKERIHGMLHSGSKELMVLVSIPEERRWILETMAKRSENKEAVRAWETEKSLRDLIRQRVTKALSQVDNADTFDRLSHADAKATDKGFPVEAIDKLLGSPRLSNEELRAWQTLRLPAVFNVVDTIDTGYALRDGFAAYTNLTSLRQLLEKGGDKADSVIDLIRLHVDLLTERALTKD